MVPCSVIAALALMLLLSAHQLPFAVATNYYVSSNGSDAAQGTTPLTAWRTLGRAAKVSLTATDALLLRRGDEWVLDGNDGDALVLVNASGVIGAYGSSGTQPLIQVSSRGKWAACLRLWVHPLASRSIGLSRTSALTPLNTNALVLLSSRAPH